MTTAEPVVDIDCAERIYAERLQMALESEHPGKVVSIHPASGDYVIAETRGDAMRAMLQKHPEGGMFLRRIGPPTPEDLRTVSRLYAERMLMS